MAESNLLERLDGLASRFEEVGTLITDPAVIADMKRFVKITWQSTNKSRQCQNNERL